MIYAERLIANISLGVMAAVIVVPLGLNVNCIKKPQTKNIVLCAKTGYQKGVASMPKLIKDWNDLAGLEPGHYKLEHRHEEEACLSRHFKYKANQGYSYIKCKECGLLNKCPSGQRCVQFNENFERVCIIGFTQKKSQEGQGDNK